jgi:hypothetical protein
MHGKFAVIQLEGRMENEHCKCLNAILESYKEGRGYLLIFMSKVFGMIDHSEHFCKNLSGEYGVFRISNFNFLYEAVFPCSANLAFGLRSVASWG